MMYVATLPGCLRRRTPSARRPSKLVGAVVYISRASSRVRRLPASTRSAMRLTDIGLHYGGSSIRGREECRLGRVLDEADAGRFAVKRAQTVDRARCQSKGEVLAKIAPRNRHEGRIV